MDTRAKVLGQPVNPVLMLLPLAILATATLADLGALLSGLRLFDTIAHADMVPGLLAGAVALCALLVDLVTATVGSPARTALALVSASFGTMIGLFAMVWSIRLDSAGNVGFFLLELIALAGGVFGAWLARGLALGRTLPRRIDPRPRPVDPAQVARAAVARRMPPRSAGYDPDATVVIFGLATTKATPRTS